MSSSVYTYWGFVFDKKDSKNLIKYYKELQSTDQVLQGFKLDELFNSDNYEYLESFIIFLNNKISYKSTSVEAREAIEPFDLLSLQPELIRSVTSYLSLKDVSKLTRSSKKLHNELMNNPSFWRLRFEKDFAPILYNGDYKELYNTRCIFYMAELSDPSTELKIIFGHKLPSIEEGINVIDINKLVQDIPRFNAKIEAVCELLKIKSKPSSLIINYEVYR